MSTDTTDTAESTDPTEAGLPAAPSSLWAIIRDLIDGGATDVDEITDAAYTILSASEREHWLRRLIRYQVTNIIRARTRKAEQAVLGRSKTKTRPKTSKKKTKERRPRSRKTHGAGPMEASGKLAGLSFALPPPHSGYVLWLEATVQQHVIRIEVLKNQENSVRETREVHEEAVRIITAAGVTCLGDLRPDQYESVTTYVAA